MRTAPATGRGPGCREAPDAARLAVHWPSRASARGSQGRAHTGTARRAALASLSLALVAPWPGCSAPQAADCDLASAQFLETGDGRPRVALSSFPGSGNTWARILLEKATGLRTGSEYMDSKLVRAGLAGEGSAHLNDTVAFKPVIQGAEPSYERAIVVLRHPAHASLSYAAYSLSHAMSHDNVVDLAQMREHMASPSLPSLTNQWHYYLWVYEMYAKAWLERMRRLGPKNALLVRYEDLVNNCPRELQRMVEFLGLSPGADDKVLCACETASLESTHRRARAYGPGDVLTSVDLRMLSEHDKLIRQLGYSADVDQPLAMLPVLGNGEDQREL